MLVAVVLAIYFTTTKIIHASTISQVSMYDGGGWCGANGGCRLKISGTGFGDEFDRPSVVISTTNEQNNHNNPGASASDKVQTPCQIINYWTSNTTIICTVAHGAYEAFERHERYKYFYVQVIHNYRHAKCTSSSNCKILFSKVNQAKISALTIPNGNVKSISFNSVVQINGNDLYNDNRANSQMILFGNINNKCNTASIQAEDSETNVPLLGNSYSQGKCRLDNELIQPGTYNMSYTSYIPHMRGTAIIKSTVLIPDLLKTGKRTFMITITPIINKIDQIGDSMYGGNELYIYGRGFSTLESNIDLTIPLAKNNVVKCEILQIISPNELYCKTEERSDGSSKTAMHESSYIGNRGITFEVYKTPSDCNGNGATFSNIHKNPSFIQKTYDLSYTYDNFDNHHSRPNMDCYTGRFHGFFTVPKTGTYAFYSRTDDGCELYFSPDSNSSNNLPNSLLTVLILSSKVANLSILVPIFTVVDTRGTS